MWLRPDVEAAAIGDWVRIAIVADDHDGDMSYGFFVPLRVCQDQKLAAISKFRVEAKDLELYHMDRL